MTPPLTLNEFTADLRDTFPDAEIGDISTQNERWTKRHTATLTLHGIAFNATYNLDPMDPSKRWGVIWSGERDVATPSELRRLMVARARTLARDHLADARKLTDRAEVLTAAAERIDAEITAQQPPTTQGD